MPVRRALIAVHDGTYLEALVGALHQCGVQVLGTASTIRLLAGSGVSVEPVIPFAALPGALAERVGALDGRVHAGILVGAHPDERAALEQTGIGAIDLVIASLRPPPAGGSLDETLAQMDVDHAALVRSAARNWTQVTVVIDPDDYARVTRAVAAEAQGGEPPPKMRRELAIKALVALGRHEAVLGTVLARFDDDPDARMPAALSLVFDRVSEVRGENPHQAAALYAPHDAPRGSLADAFLYGGGDDPTPTFAQALDANRGMELVGDLAAPACALLARGRPVAVASAADLARAFAIVEPWTAHGLSATTLAFNVDVPRALVERIGQLRVDSIVAPAYDGEAVLALKHARADLCIVATRALLPPSTTDPTVVTVRHGVLVETRDAAGAGELAAGRVTSAVQPKPDELAALDLAWLVAKHAPSDAVVLARREADGTVRTLAIATACPSRAYAVDLALNLAGPAAAGAVLASDGPIEDRAVIGRILERGVVAMAHPGGALDAEVIAAGTHVLVVIATGVSHLRA